ncbi:MAG: TrkA family potassium uptake protein [Phycisphaerae bacterium]|nr:TrkA family potassium uptake protein [Phycisphaerae bacterium]
MARTKHSYVIVIGCGRLGSFLANTLSKTGHSVVVIDINPNAFSALAAEAFSGFTVEGDATELAVLKQAKMDKADVVIGATHDENVNIMAAQIARSRFRVHKVLVRIEDPNKESYCKAVGIDYICPTALTAEKMMTALNDIR